MNFNFDHFKILPEELYEDVNTLLRVCDEEFVPPLSSRSGTQDCDLDNDIKKDSVRDYFQSLLEQEFVTATDGSHLAGFLSFRHKPNDEIYVSTIIVNPDYRNHAVASRLYEKLFNVCPKAVITTRTWSTNANSNHLLKKLGFTESKRIENDRGEGVDTVYFELVL